MDQTLAAGHIYTGTLASDAPRQYEVVGPVDGDTVDLRYGWFGFEDGTVKGLSDTWSWSAQGVHASRADFVITADLGPAPEAGDPRSMFPWAQ